MRLFPDTIGAHSKVVLYQQCFSVPGFDINSEVFISRPEPLTSLSEPLNISVVAKKVEFIEYIGVVATNSSGEMPSIRVREINGGNDDINAGFKGKYISLVPVYTTNKDKAATRFDLILNDGPLPAEQVAANEERRAQGKPCITDLAEGAGGLYRYLVPVADPRVTHKVTGLALLREFGGPGTDIHSLGYNGMSMDLNRSRKGDWLYVLWRTVHAS
ncbi:hypothetical protein EST38_g4913 [Candolleomyces aberdarensis]|uniref:Uncharacterized protein n=1 Tax=Candolleomyces aberdarensis TaxID=2316362 RepID=A0A4Q2DLR4_9AGAR|nr:hypothetical protein EST38_g4913 [Candolleomyces aberdarensis]